MYKRRTTTYKQEKKCLQQLSVYGVVTYILIERLVILGGGTATFAILLFPLRVRVTRQRRIQNRNFDQTLPDPWGTDWIRTNQST